MFFSNNSATYSDQNISHLPKTCATQFNRSLLAVALLGSIGVLSAPALAADTDNKVQNNRKDAVNTYIMSKEQSKVKAPELTDNGKIKADYEKLANSVNVLSQTLKRESDKAGADNSMVIGKIESSSTEAAQLAKSGAYEQAREMLNHSYQMLTAEIVKLKAVNGQSGQAANIDAAGGAKSGASANGPRQYVERALKTNAALLNALIRQNEIKAGGKESDINVIKATAADANAALGKGDIASARMLIDEANSLIKETIASLQAMPDAKSGNTTTGVASHEEDGAAAQASYAKRKDAVIALLDAGKRIDGERGTTHPNFVKAGAMINEADKLVAEGKFTEGKARLDETYQLIQNEMRKMMSRKKGAK